MSQTYYLIKCMSLWNWTKDTTLYFLYKFYYFYTYVKAYVLDSHNKWIFIPGHTIPIVTTAVHNLVDHSWSYSSTDNQLSYKKYTQLYSFSWLSAKLVIYQNESLPTEYNIDDFIYTLRIATQPDRLPTLTMLFMIWCVHNKQWFKPISIIEFHIIDDCGEERILSLYNDNTCLKIDGHKIDCVKN